MKGRCANCQAMQAKGIPDYCCLRCVLALALPELPAERITRQADGTTVIDLSKPLP